MAAVVLVLYLLTAFGLRSLQQYRRTGEIGFRGVTGSVGSLEWWGGLLFAVALVLGLVAPALQLAEVVAPVVRDPIFTAMIVAGLGLTLLAPDPVALVGCARAGGRHRDPGPRSRGALPDGHPRADLPRLRRPRRPVSARCRPPVAGPGSPLDPI